MKRWFCITGGILLLLVAAGFVAYRAIEVACVPTTYRARATILFNADPSGKGKRALFSLRRDDLVSTNILYLACQSLDLPRKWGWKYGFDGTPLSVNESCAILSRRIAVEVPADEDKPVQVLAYSDQPQEAAEMAEAVASTYVNWAGKSMPATDGRGDSRQNVQTDPPERFHQWFLWLWLWSITAIIVIPCSVAGLIFIRTGRRFPPFVPLPEQTTPSQFSKY